MTDKLIRKVNEFLCKSKEAKSWFTKSELADIQKAHLIDENEYVSVIKWKGIEDINLLTELGGFEESESGLSEDDTLSAKAQAVNFWMDWEELQEKSISLGNERLSTAYRHGLEEMKSWKQFFNVH